MSISCSILLKENSFINATDLYNVMEKISKEKKFFFAKNMVESDSENRIKLIRTNISDRPFRDSVSRQLNVDIYDEPYKFKEISFDWYDNNIVFFEAIVIDSIDGNEDLLFYLTFDFLSLYPEALLWIEEDWFYSLKDLEKMNPASIEEDWCYQNPSEF
ncbi:hypothetical protein [Enterococcus sp. LJL51]|uniref:hypothetical protein n=1 Tax=Enterococcus sp. LJL51 TaxID=3416656 RepID=UPI003CF35F51